MPNHSRIPFDSATDIQAAIQLFEQDLLRSYPPGMGRLPTHQLGQMFATFCSDVFDCSLVVVWSIDPLNETLLLVAASGSAKFDIKWPVLDYRIEFSQKAIETRRIIVSDCRSPGANQIHESIYLQAINHLNLETVINLPVLVASNPNQVMLLIDLFPRMAGRIAFDSNGELENQTSLQLLAETLGRLHEMYLRDEGIRLASRLNLELAKVPKELPSERYSQLARIIQTSLDLHSVVLYMERPNRRGIEAKASAGIRLPSTLERVLQLGLADDAWNSNRERLIHSLRKDIRLEARSIRRAMGQNDFACAIVPVRDLAGKPKGALLCAKQFPATQPNKRLPFTYEDIAIIEAVCEGFAPHLAVILADEQRDDLLSKVAHEVRVPIVALRAAFERIELECNSNGWRFRYPYLREIKNYTLLMTLLLKNLDTIRKGAHFIPLEPIPTALVPSILAPAKRFVVPLLRKRAFKENQIEHFGIEEWPLLYLDPLLMMSVVFNLLENAIKYYQGDPADFAIEIEGRQDNNKFQLIFRDWGIGVPEANSARIFAAGERADNAIETGEPGDGLGLWFARTLIQRHTGSLTLRSNGRPTEFMVELPGWIADHPPSKYEQDPVNR